MICLDLFPPHFDIIKFVCKYRCNGGLYLLQISGFCSWWQHARSMEDLTESSGRTTFQHGLMVLLDFAHVHVV